MGNLIVALSRRPEIRYLVVGGLNTAFSYGLYTIALLLLHLIGAPADYAIAVTFSWIASNLTSYLLQRKFVFGRNGRSLTEFLRFTSVTFGSFMANLAMSWFAVSILSLTSAAEKLVSQLVITVILVAITYILHKSFSFRHNGVAPSGMVAVDEDANTRPESPS